MAFTRPLLALYIGTRALYDCCQTHTSQYWKAYSIRPYWSTAYSLTHFDLSYSLSFVHAGKEAANTPGLLDSAVDYVKIRAFSMPTSLFGGVIQAALLGGQDSVTPLVAILYSTVINVVGDYLLVKRYGMGLQGAAIATLVAQVVATMALVQPARRKLVRDHSFGLLKKPKVTSETVSGRPFLAFAAPVLTLILGKLAAFGFLTNSAAGVPGQPTPLASHQIILSLFFFVSPFLEVISQTAQTFIPAFLAPVSDHVAKMKKKNPKYNEDDDPTVTPWKRASFDVGTTLLRLGFISGSIVATLASLVPFANAGMLTSDKSLQAAVKPLAKYLWMGAFLTAPVAVSEGILLARRELKYLASVYLVSTALLPPVLWRIKTSGGTVDQIWACFAIFQLFRAMCFAGRIWTGSFTKRIGSFLHMNKSSKVTGKAG
jgi:Na+-driven multidrug efflux pump